MGMSASQARLLTITGRLTDNELRSQTITNSKLRLAQKSSEASQAYMDALNSEKLTYKYYNDNGESASYNLTPALIYSYEPLKNQYSIQNASGQNLVSATDAKNYEETDSLYEFLKRYGLVEGYTRTETETVTNPEYNAWVVSHDSWVKSEPKPDDYTTTTETEVTKRINTSPIYPELTGKLGGCFGIAVNGDNCYMHVLSALIGVGEHTTSDGHTYNIYYEEDKCEEHNEDWCWNTYSRNNEEIGDDLRQSLYTDELSKEAYNDYIKTGYGNVKCTGSGTDTEKYGNNVYQKIVDFLWEVHDEYVVGRNNGARANPDSLARFFYLIEFDLGDSHTETSTETNTELDPGAYEEAHKKWEESEPGEPPKTITKTKTIDDIAINDKSKGQWYTNLWYMMNGSETANVVVEDKDSEENLFKVNGAEKNLKMSNSSNYKVIDDQLLTSNEWLTFALKNGIVTLKQASYFNPATDSGKVAELNSEGYFWNSTAYSSTTDIVAVEDEVAIAKAEVKYKNTTTEIENQDKKFDQDLKKLDTEHNALQTEYESLKSVIDKNVDRSFKAFS